MTVTDEGKRSLAYTPELYEVAVQGMTMKARWMARTLRAVAADALVVLDEPYLCSFGSAFVNVSREDVVAALEGAAAAIHAEGALCGLHCCGNTDWSLVLQTGVDVVNFDAHEYFQGLSLYPAELAAFLERGGVLSWGIVPASAAAAEIGAEGLLRELDAHLAELERKGLPRERLLAAVPAHAVVRDGQPDGGRGGPGAGRARRAGRALAAARGLALQRARSARSFAKSSSTRPAASLRSWSYQTLNAVSYIARARNASKAGVLSRS